MAHSGCKFLSWVSQPLAACLSAPLEDHSGATTGPLAIVISAHLPEAQPLLHGPVGSEGESVQAVQRPPKAKARASAGKRERVAGVRDEDVSAGARIPARGKGGLCTQALLHELSRLERGLPAEQRGSVTLGKLLAAMHDFLVAGGFPTALLTVRSSSELPGALEVARALGVGASGRQLRRALLVGVRYVNAPERSQLQGPWNDICDMCAWLVNQHGWATEDVCMLLDRDGCEPPTRKNILKGLDWLLQGGAHFASHSDAPLEGPAGCRLLHFSGHGDKRKLLPMDWETAGGIRDDDLLEVVKNARLPEGCAFTCILDCCESSSFFQRSFHYKAQLP
mmetsp:Transcript_112908/g.319327  ORF Transcript_112908/g.319327 Transcript_112908/m.319327 type:complete len:337 (+) Transcript_112908:78-1088(+)